MDCVDDCVLLKVMWSFALMLCLVSWVSTYTSQIDIDFTTHYVAVMGSNDTPSTYLMAQMLTQIPKKKDF